MNPKIVQISSCFCEVYMYPTAQNNCGMEEISIFLIGRNRDVDTIANEFVQVQRTRNTIQSYNQRGSPYPKGRCLLIVKKKVIKENPQGEREVHFSKPTNTLRIWMKYLLDWLHSSF